VHVFVVFGNVGGLLFISFYKINVNVRVCNLHNPHHTDHIENYKQHTVDLQLGALFLRKMRDPGNEVVHNAVEGLNSGVPRTNPDSGRDGGSNHSPSYPLSEFVLGSPEFNSSTACFNFM